MTCRTWIRKKPACAFDATHMAAAPILQANAQQSVAAPSIGHKAAPGLDRLADELAHGVRAAARETTYLLLPVDATGGTGFITGQSFVVDGGMTVKMQHV